jgi:carbon-monoxide dehydrogenase large subunit
VVARDLDVDPVEFRRKNFIQPDAFPFETGLGRTYDSGDYEKTLDAALDRIDYEEFRERQAQAREAGRYLGVGLSWNELGVPFEDVEVLEGDTAEVDEGNGTGGSRAMPVGGGAEDERRESDREGPPDRRPPAGGRRG